MLQILLYAFTMFKRAEFIFQGFRGTVERLKERRMGGYAREAPGEQGTMKHGWAEKRTSLAT